MAEPTNKEIFDKVADLRSYLTKVDEHKLVTDGHLKAQLPKDFIAKFDEMHQELKKEPWTEYLEGMGLDGFAAALEKRFEKNADWMNWLAAAVVGLAVPAIGVMLAAQLVNISRKLQTLGNPDRPVITGNGSGGFMRQHIDDINAREDRVFNGGSGIADIPRDANFDPLREQIERLTPKLAAFNEAAGPFNTNFRNLPKESQLNKAAAGIEKVSKAASEAKPTDIKAVARATNKLANAQRNFDPKKLPKARGLASSAAAAERLAKAGDDVATAFTNLKNKAEETARVLAAG
ncbi:hypothetical protein AB0K02_07380 [Streptomyces sp. NPDC049597]|uniref:hypothetical protein n=1 Tax=Streptomyces sp. NPDC049597 TaxID=3155276 RepID=UPI003439CB1D